MSNAIVDIDRARPVWVAAVLDCDACGHAWCAPVHEAGLHRGSILCPSCHEMAAAVIATVDVDSEHVDAPALVSYYEALRLAEDPLAWGEDA